MKNSLVSFIMALALAPPAIAQVEASPDSVDHKRLVEAWSHLTAAESLARGGAVQPIAAYAKAGDGKTDIELRHEIRIMADNVATAGPTTAPLAKLDAATHLHMARLKLTAGTDRSFEEVRKDVRAVLEKVKKEERPAALSKGIRRQVRYIEEALRAP